MSGVNGPDIAAVYQLLTQVARTVTGHDRKLDDLSAEVAGLGEVVAAHDRKLDDLAAGLASLRDAVTPLSFKRAGPRTPDQRAGRTGAPYRAASKARARRRLTRPASALKSIRDRAGCCVGRGR